MHALRIQQRWWCLTLLSEGVTYSQVSAGRNFSVLLKSDGTAVGFGNNHHGQLRPPEIAQKEWIAQVSAGDRRTAYLLNTGRVVSVGHNSFRAECHYTQVSAGGLHCLFLRSDGYPESERDLSIPREPFLTNLQCMCVSAGFGHSAMILSDGTAIAWGNNEEGQCNIPRLEEGMIYLQVAAGIATTILLRNDNRLVEVGAPICGRGHYAVPMWPCPLQIIVQLELQKVDESERSLRLGIRASFTGEQLASHIQWGDHASLVHTVVAHELPSHRGRRLVIMLPDGSILSSCATMEDFLLLADAEAAAKTSRTCY